MKKIVYQIRNTVYRNQPGFLVMSLEGNGFGHRIFVQSRIVADHIKGKLIAGQELTLADYQEVA